MPLELIPMERGRKILTPADRGFLINLTKARWNRNASTEALKLLISFRDAYYEDRCPDEVKTEVKEEQMEDETGNNEEGKEKTGESGDATKPTTPATPDKFNRSGIFFVIREMVHEFIGFIACNLSDPADYAHFVMTKLSENYDPKKIKMPFRILPIQRICEAKPKAVEKTITSFLEEVVGTEDDFPYRFSVIYRGTRGCENLSPKEAKHIVRNVIWSLNPNCVQCIKYQDFAVVMDILDPLLCFGVARDFQRLASYNTHMIRLGQDRAEDEPDSEDEISDDPTLNEEDERKRKLRIKRKRRAQRNQTEGEDNNANEDGDNDEGNEDFEDAENAQDDGDNAEEDHGLNGDDAEEDYGEDNA